MLQPDEYDVRELLDVRVAKGRRQFLVAWTGFAESDNTCASVARPQCCVL